MTALQIGGPFTVDLVDADEDHLVVLATVAAEPGHYNALSWALVPDALGFDAFVAGGVHDMSLDGLHLGHVGEGHCHVSAR